MNSPVSQVASRTRAAAATIQGHQPVRQGL